MIRRYLLSFLLLGVTGLSLPASATWAKDGPAAKPTIAVFTFGGTITEAPAADDFPFAHPASPFTACSGG